MPDVVRSGMLDLSKVGERSESIPVAGLLGVATVHVFTPDGAFDSGVMELKSVMNNKAVSLASPVTVSASGTVLRGVDVADEAELVWEVTTAAGSAKTAYWWIYAVGP